MIQLNVDFTLLNRFFGISPAKIQQYRNKDIDEIMKIEAAQGNTKAADYEKILTDPDKLLDIFRLTNIENKFIIIQNLSEHDLDNLLPYLNQEQLSKGLNFFTEEKLMAMCTELPLEPLIGMIFEKFDMFDILSLMDDDSMNQFLLEPEADREYVQNYFESLNDDMLEQIMVQSFGIDFKDKKRDEYLTHLENMDDTKFKSFMISMERESKMGLINNMVEQEADLLYLFEPEDIVAPMAFLMKADKVKLMSTLEPEFLVPMIQELPLDLTQIVATQIDAQDFSEILARDFQDVLSSVVLFK